MRMCATSSSAITVAITLVAVFSFVRPAWGLEDGSQVEQQAGVEEHLDRQVGLDRPFVDETGKSVTLRELILPNRPLILIPVYYTCPRLCSLTLAAARSLFNDLELELGEDFTVAALSFNSAEKPDIAKKRADEYREQLKTTAKRESWRFLTGKDEEIKPTMDELGFKYVRDNGEFAHTSAFMVLTPDGHISRYFYGVAHQPKEARFALVDAAKGKIGSSFDRFLLYCFHYDSRNGRYTLLTMNVARVVGVGSLVGLAALVITLRHKEKRKAEF